MSPSSGQTRSGACRSTDSTALAVSARGIGVSGSAQPTPPPTLLVPSQGRRQGRKPCRTRPRRRDYLGLPVGRLTDRQAVSQAVKRGLSAMTSLRTQMVVAFRASPGQSTAAVRDFAAKAGADPTLAQGWPSFARANEESRGDLVQGSRQPALALRSAKSAANAGGTRPQLDAASARERRVAVGSRLTLSPKWPLLGPKRAQTVRSRVPAR